ncbi:hypothetical protein, partial [Pseudomonas viridiflava]|uniref:hypothetical protein n=1 Tax=Pseudomonas viridiflava TaxID=33069 RepID=UPI0019D289A2
MFMVLFLLPGALAEGEVHGGADTCCNSRNHRVIQHHSLNRATALADASSPLFRSLHTATQTA